MAEISKTGNFMSIERISNTGRGDDRPFGEIITHESPDDQDERDRPEMPEEKPQIEEIIPEPSKKDKPPPFDPPTQEELDEIWKRILSGADKPN